MAFADDGAATPGRDDLAGLTLVANFGVPQTATTAFGLPCADETSGLDGRTQPLAGCLSLGPAPRGGADPSMTSGVGLRYGLGGWLRLDAGLSVRSGLADATAGLSAASAAPGSAGVSAFGTGGVGAGVSAVVDVNAATGLDLWGIRPYLGAGVAAGHVETPAGLHRDGAGAAVAMSPTSGTGVSWGATAGTNVSLGDGLSLDFAYRYSGSESDGPLDQGPALGLGRGVSAAPAGDTTGGDHGMSMGLRLRF
ncbi:hypothetical protein [uncultured Rhodospira sp.]|uniref:hypothetical protein n=1 Tax=uncultured Rhodospira sp. TaxID=1936189 RepID=UPI0026082996|nr:hypothetical protein [uncultured Rhodospira sp.]